ncbi:protein of unknown function (DUF3883) [Mariprofundus aestuarium]|uniref:Uncharacterized protein n=1 Tax=Mariprofundus aestuarium TaxID=1921086 RepID=A0A2K8KWS1_MARES|nr:DUF3427 domain-containing protein [Mariprofundus aestuarium]ATX79122.1 protein of unknown function (DUF3883) [Mariprofundus aestuarium]
MANRNENVSIRNFVFGETYSRTDVAETGKVTPPGTPRAWNGIVRFKNCILLFVTLDKKDFDKKSRYNDIFEDAGQTFYWESQNRNTSKSPIIKSILSDNNTYLFARIKEKVAGRTEPFAFVGRLEAEASEGDKPVKVLFSVCDYIPSPTDALYNLYHWREEAPLSQKPALTAWRPTKRQTKQSGQGRLVDPEKKKAIENHAMRMAAKHYANLGFSVDDTSSNSPYDYLCKMNETQKRVEVKGTTMGPGTVNVTFNEVESARSNGCETDLFIAHAINVERKGGKFITSGGKKKIISNWTPKDADLTPTAYTYKVPAQ